MSRFRPLILIFLIFSWLNISLGRTTTFDEARHLLSRTSFGVTWDQIQTLTQMEYGDAVRHVSNTNRSEPLSSPPEWVSDPLINRKKFKQLSESERKKLREKRRTQALDIKAWWLKEMVTTVSPMTERMTLFWHNHFTSSMKKVKVPYLMFQQNLLLRRHALGNFRQLIHNVAKDPAMIIYLDNVSNVKNKPNENFARELLELFTLGEGHYSETDIKEAARAFTGWAIDRDTGTFRFLPRRHDFGSKTFMGETGTFNGEDIIDIILKQPRVATYITEKFWREFISGTPAPKELHRLATIFRDQNYEIKPLMHALLTSSYFKDSRKYGTMIKSPVELLVGTLRTFKVPISSSKGLAVASRRMGQDVLDPPNVKGWGGGTRWITSDTLLVRQDILERLLRGKEMQRMPKRVSSPKISGRTMQMDVTATFGQGLDTKTIVKLLLPIPPVEPVNQAVSRPELIHSSVLDPVFQLK
jgi:uncharacterized protein (DUF1800 family)